MPTSFSFSSNTLETETHLHRGHFTTGAHPLVNDPAWFSAVAPSQSIESAGDVDVLAITLVAGQRYSFDIDTTSGIDLQLDLIGADGRLVATSDNPSGTRDPLLVVDVNRTGTYFVAVHQAANDYVDGEFRFLNLNGSTGSYGLAISTPSLPVLQRLTAGADSRTYSDYGQNVDAGAGDDRLWMQGGHDIAHGGAGNDSLIGGAGEDELAGGDGDDRLWGETGNDALIGGVGRDSLYGGSGNDALSGYGGNDLLHAGTGDDRIWGHAGNDTLVGDAGNDLLRGGQGIDTLFGGAGADSFHFLREDSPHDPYFRVDVIEDFVQGDRIDLSDLTAGTLAWRYTASFTGANQVYVTDAGNGYQRVLVNLDSDSTAEFSLVVDTDDGSVLDRYDFLL